jgi:hypothetical protein
LGVVQWAANGVALCAATGNQEFPTIVSEGASGAIVTWQDYRGGSSTDVYAQRVNASGVVQWAANGVALCTATWIQYSPRIVSDGAGGGIVTWYDYRGGAQADIYAQRVNASGAVQWTTDGVALCTATGIQQYPTITSDGTGGAIVTWQDYRGGSSTDVYAQRVNASGAVQWTANGVALCTAASNQWLPTIASDGACGAIVTWGDYRSGSEYDIYAQLTDSSGRVGFLAPAIYAVRDVPGDQGGKVYFSWYGARSDVLMDGQMSSYSIWRAIKPTKASMALESGAVSLSDLSKLDLTSGKPVIRMEQTAGGTFFWQLVETVNASHMPAYGVPVATLFDSTTYCKEYSYFQVVAHTTDPMVFWASAPDSGYSVDNLPPGTPVGLAGQQKYTPAGLSLKWDRSTAPDLANYAIYRGTDASFVPGPSNFIASPTDTTSFDSSWRWESGYYYKVSAIDIHGNESGFALLTPDDIAGTDTPKAPDVSYLSQNYPNPFNPMTRIGFGLSASGPLSLRIYDATGRLIRVLLDGRRAAGIYTEVWDGRDEGGQSVSSGVYFYRLDAGSFRQTRKMIILQ